MTITDTHLEAITGETGSFIDSLLPIGLSELNSTGALQTRQDRKYVVTDSQLSAALDLLKAQNIYVLEICYERWLPYSTTYFDTPSKDSYRLTATHRPNRFKARTRTYSDGTTCVLEVKTKSRLGKTIKHRQDHSVGESEQLDASSVNFLKAFPEVEPYADSLEATLQTSYRRATLLFPYDPSRATIDQGLQVNDMNGKSTFLQNKFIVETKTSGNPSPLDKALWSTGIRPTKISKFATGMAALDPTLPANKWHRVLKQHF